jgi:hypothetical protein
MLSAITSWSTPTIALVVVLISFLQWRTNREKLRLDLYQKRFEIYSRLLDFSEALSKWRSLSEIDRQNFKNSFIKALNESSFLFPDKSGVHALLQKFGEDTQYIVNFDSSVFEDATNEERKSQYKAFNDCIRKSDGIIKELKENLRPFLSFE